MTIFFRKHYAAVREAAKTTLLAADITESSLSAVSFFTRDVLPRCEQVKVKLLLQHFLHTLMLLEGKGVHIVTVNDYLAKRDADVDGSGSQDSLALLLVLYLTCNGQMTKEEKHITVILHMLQTTSLVSITFEITWLLYKEQHGSERTSLLPLSMRSTQYLLTKPEHLLLFQDRACKSAHSFMNCMTYLLNMLTKGTYK